LSSLLLTRATPLSVLPKKRDPRHGDFSKQS
jgi:hypothetical protein